MKTMLWRSPNAVLGLTSVLVSFSTESDSPVRDASCTLRLKLSITRPSAGTMLPASSNTMSPGTSSDEGTSCSRPPRRTRTLGALIFCKAAIAFSARYSWLTPSAALATTMSEMAITLLASPSNAETTAAPIKISTSGSDNCSSKMRRGFLTPWSVSSLVPYFSRRVSTSESDKPWARVTPSRSSTTCGSRSHGMLSLGRGVVGAADLLALAGG